MTFQYFFKQFFDFSVVAIRHFAFTLVSQLFTILDDRQSLFDLLTHQSAFGFVRK